MFDTDNLNKYNKIVFWLSTWDVNDELKKYIKAWNYLDIKWTLNNFSAYKFLVENDTFKCY